MLRRIQRMVKYLSSYTKHVAKLQIYLLDTMSKSVVSYMAVHLDDQQDL